VPIYAVTEMGRSLLQARLEQISVPPKGEGPEDPPVPLV
jgi:hypothetical protein